MFYVRTIELPTAVCFIVHCSILLQGRSAGNLFSQVLSLLQMDLFRVCVCVGMLSDLNNSIASSSLAIGESLLGEKFKRFFPSVFPQRQF